MIAVTVGIGSVVLSGCAELGVLLLLWRGLLVVPVLLLVVLVMLLLLMVLMVLMVL